jgi:UDP-N-acetylmuramoyl-L-alanyl-D-glutamate--2,6-diaminopimelate ligase
MNFLRTFLARLLPRPLYRVALRSYHALWAFGSALVCGFPARRLTVIGITGTKGKSSVSEMLFAILRHAGYPTAMAGTIRFAINEESRPNLFKMTMPGRGFLQTFLKDAVSKGAKYAVLEVTSEGAVQNRHLFLAMDALIFTNLQREHIESHGGMEQYARAKFRLGEALAASPKRPRAIVANSDSEYAKPYLTLPVETKLPFGIGDVANISYQNESVSFIYEGVSFDIPQPGEFSVRNALAAIKAAAWLGVPVENSAEALHNLTRIPGRAEKIEEGQDFLAVVDYAHTPDSLTALYGAYGKRRKICVLGNTGGGRDTWKRPLMGKIADEHCEEVILANEDPYDEDPNAIVEAMASGMSRPPRIIMDRREAIAAALSLARPGDAVLITGKGTDPYIMEADGKRTPWSDAQVVREELERILKSPSTS